MEFDFDKEFSEMMEANGLDRVVLLGHVNSDGDSTGSVMGLAHYIHVNYPDYRVFPYLAENMDKGARKLANRDPVFDPLKRPETEGQRYGVIICDTAVLKRLVGRELYEGAVVSMVIDHHISNERYGDINYVKVSEACAENVYRILNREKLQRAAKEGSPTAADYIYMGILHDTNGFTRAGASIMEAAADLMRMGVEHEYIMDTMRKDSFENLQRRAALLERVERTPDGKTAWVCVDYETCRKEKIGYEEIHPVGEILRECVDIELAFSMFEQEKGLWRCSFRSDGKWINVDKLAAFFGGGGHAGAAGVRKRTEDGEAFKKQILERVAEMRG